MLTDVKRFAAQPRHEQAAHVIVSESYRVPKSGFLGRLLSSGLQGLVRLPHHDFVARGVRLKRM